MYRRSSGIYVVRLAVPKRLRGALGRTEIHVSTELRELPAARIAALRILLSLRQKFMDLDLLQVVQGSPLLRGDGLVSLEASSRLTGISRAALCHALRERGALVYVLPAGLSGVYVDDLYEDVDRDPATGEFEWVAGVDQGTRMSSFSDQCTLHESAAALVALGERGLFEAALLRPTGAPDAAFLPDSPLSLTTQQAYALKTDVEALRAQISAGVTREQLATAKRNQEHSSRPQQAGPDDMTFSRLLELYLSEQAGKLKSEHLSRMEKEGRYFLNLVGDLPLREIDRPRVISKFKNEMLRLPADMRKARSLCGSGDLRDLIATAVKHGLPLKTQATVDRHILKVSEIFAHGCRYLRVSDNPLRGLVKKNKKGAKKQNDRRNVFESDLLRRIFSAPWFLTGSAPDAHFRPYYYWLPLLALYTGARISELAQLYLHDIKHLGEGRWVFDFNLNEPDKVAPSKQELAEDQWSVEESPDDREGKSLKNENASRVVSVHSFLIKLGLPEYVKALEAAGYQRLFPEILKSNSKDRYGVAPAKWFNDAFLGKQLGVVRDGRTTFHSFRHTVSAALDRLSVRETDVAQILGHSRGQTTSFRVYGKDKDVSPTIELLHFPETDAVAKFDVESGLSAVRRALALKRANQGKRSSGK